MRDTTRRRMIQLSGGIALASMAGCLGSDDDDGNDGKNDDGDGSNDGDDTGDEPKSGDEAPDFELETPDGDTVELEPIEKPTIVLFADITSETGKSHSETLVDIREKHDDHARVITVNSDLDASKEDLEAFRGEYGGDWTHAMGTADVIEKYGIDAAVTLCIIDEDGELLLRLDGQVSASSIEQALEEYADG